MDGPLADHSTNNSHHIFMPRHLLDLVSFTFLNAEGSRVEFQRSMSNHADWCA